jgi:NAD(P)-dependent dehydrogenase (short-subunit alcohol dehydrogenase family)
MPSILITGSNRGLGLEWVRQYLDVGWRVYATCRSPNKAVDLHQLQQAYNSVSIHQLDVTQPDQIQRVKQELASTKLDLLINNAGMYYERWGKDKLDHIDYEAWEESFRVNTLGAIRMTEALRANLSRSEKRLVVSITSHMGSIGDITSANDYAYRSSKAALNAVMKGLVYELAEEGIGILLLHPGWVRTRMGGSSAPLSANESVSNMRRLVDVFRQEDNGKFYRYDGEVMPW